MDCSGLAVAGRQDVAEADWETRAEACRVVLLVVAAYQVAVLAMKEVELREVVHQAAAFQEEACPEATS